jgi:hypothetical protein
MKPGVLAATFFAGSALNKKIFASKPRLFCPSVSKSAPRAGSAG